MQGIFVTLAIIVALIFILKNLRRQLLTGEDKKCETCAVNELVKQQGKKHTV